MQWQQQRQFIEESMEGEISISATKEVISCDGLEDIVWVDTATAGGIKVVSGVNGGTNVVWV